MRKLLRRLAPQACPQPHTSAYAVACGDCGVDMNPKRSLWNNRRDSALVWLLGGAVVGCVTMLLLAPQH